MIGDAVALKKLRARYRTLVAVRDAGYGRVECEAHIAGVLTEMWELEGRLNAEGLHMNADDELVQIPMGAAA